MLFNKNTQGNWQSVWHAVVWPQIQAVGGPSNLIVSVSHAIKQEVLHRGCKNNPYKFCNLK